MGITTSGGFKGGGGGGEGRFTKENYSFLKGWEKTVGNPRDQEYNSYLTGENSKEGEKGDWGEDNS